MIVRVNKGGVTDTGITRPSPVTHSILLPLWWTAARIMDYRCQSEAGLVSVSLQRYCEYISINPAAGFIKEPARREESELHKPVMWTNKTFFLIITHVVFWLPLHKWNPFMRNESRWCIRPVCENVLYCRQQLWELMDVIYISILASIFHCFSLD